MDIPQQKVYLCIICKEKYIIEARIEHTNESAAMCDIQNCDFSDYSDHKVNGGKLLQKRPNIHWRSYTYKLPDKEIPVGGVCNDCLKNPIVLSLIDHIQFQTNSR